jgi:hypothetical protein
MMISVRLVAEPARRVAAVARVCNVAGRLVGWVIRLSPVSHAPGVAD